MGMSSSESVKVAKEKSGCTRGGVRFLEKRQRMGEGPAVIEVRCHKDQPHRTKKPFSDIEHGQGQATPGSMT